MQGLNPTEAVLLTLLGVIVGAMVTGVVRLVLDRRTERAEFTAAMWLLVDDLDRMAAVVDHPGGPSSSIGVARSELDADASLAAWLQSDTWRSERRTIARGLADDRDLWDQLRWAMLQADVLRRLAASRERGRGDAQAITRWIATEDEFRKRLTVVRAGLMRYDGRKK